MNDLQPLEYSAYLKEYDRIFYDIRTRDGKEYLNCWPNAGSFYPSQGNRVREKRCWNFVSQKASFIHLKIPQYHERNYSRG